MFCFIGYARGQSRPSSVQDSGTPSSFTEDTVLLLDIYGATSEDVRACKVEMTDKLDRALQTLMWTDKPSYEEDRVYIPKLSTSQVCTMSCSSTFYLERY